MPSLIESIAKVGSNTFLSRIMGFLRDMVVARAFGADAGTDAFFLAFKIPNFMRRLFAEGAFAVAFVPVLNEYKTKQGTSRLKDFVDSMAGTFEAVLLGVTFLGVLGAPVLILIFAPGFAQDTDKLAMAVEMLRLTFPYLMFISLTAFAGGILNTYERFGVPAFTPVLLNVAMILCAIWLAPEMERPVFALAWGVFIAGVAQLVFQLPFLWRIGMLPRPRVDFKDPGVRRVITLMVPALFGVSVTQIGLLLNTILASYLVTGSITWLYYGDRLMEFPLGILGVGLGTVILPRLSQKHAEQSPVAFSRTLDWALRWVLLLGVPSAVGLVVLAGPMMTALFYSGKFTGQDVIMTAQALMAYALGLTAFMGIKVLAPGFYARQDMKTPVKIAMVAMVVNVAFSLLLMFHLGHIGLALATTLSAIVNAGLLLRGLRREGIYRPETGWPALLARGLAASTVMGLVVWWGSGETTAWLEMGTWEARLKLLGWILVGGTAYALALLALGIRPRHFSSGAMRDS